MPDLTDEQMDAVGEYAGLLLVKYDANNRIRLLPREDVEAYDKKQAELEAKLEEKTERWVYLTELKEKIDAQNG